MGEFRERFELARQQYCQALDRLNEVIEMEESSIIRDSLIQRFEFCYELAWKSMFFWLKDEGEQVREMQRAVIHAAFRCELISDPMLWEKIKECRDETSHTYNELKAIEVSGFVRQQALPMFEQLRSVLRTL